MHKSEDHTDNYKKRCTDKSSDKEGEKKVSFAATTTEKGGKEKDNTASEGDDEPKVQVQASLLKDAKAYLAQFQDFPAGGSSE